MALRVIAPGVQDEIRDAIRAVAPASVAVSIGYPAGGLEAEHVWISAGYEAEIRGRVSGGGQRDEDGALAVRIVATRSTEDPVEVRDRAGELAGYVEDAIAADPTLGGLVADSHVSGSVGQEAIPDETTRQYGIEIRIEYTATATR